MFSGLIAGAVLLAACASRAPGPADVDPSGLTGARGTGSAGTEPGTLTGGSLGNTSSEPSPSAGPTEAGGAAQAPITLRGWLSIVWNERAHFFLTADDGSTAELDLPEELTRPFGGTLALDRRRVVVVVSASPQPPEPLLVLSIALEAEG
jgi:hypothetical protein